MWQVITNPEVDSFILNLEVVNRNKIRHTINLLKEYGYLLRAPHSKKLTGYSNLFELRSSGNSPIRLLYTFYQNKYFVFVGFIKKTNKTPQQKINTALDRIRELTIK